MAYSECVPTRLKPLAERTCFSQVAGGPFLRAKFDEARKTISAGPQRSLFELALDTATACKGQG